MNCSQARRNYLENLCRRIVGELERVSSRANPWRSPGQIRGAFSTPASDRDVRFCLKCLLTAQALATGKDHKGRRVYRTLVSASPW